MSSSLPSPPQSPPAPIMIRPQHEQRQNEQPSFQRIHRSKDTTHNPQQTDRQTGRQTTQRNATQRSATFFQRRRTTSPPSSSKRWRSTISNSTVRSSFGRRSPVDPFTLTPVHCSFTIHDLLVDNNEVCRDDDDDDGSGVAGRGVRLYRGGRAVEKVVDAWRGSIGGSHRCIDEL